MPLLKTQKIIFAILSIGCIAPTWATTSKINPINHLKTNSATANIALSSSQLVDKPVIFQAGSSHELWSGYLKKRAVSQHANGNMVINQEAEWDAGQLLTNQQAPANRTIVSYNPLNKRTIAFELGQFPDDIQTLFNLLPGTQITDDFGKQRVDYLKGDRTLESAQTDPTVHRFKVREHVLGSIVHSTPVYVGAPTKNRSDADYSSFYEKHKTRPGTVFVGANDGMLHAFSAESGTELFAYVPSPLLKKLPKLTSSDAQYEITMDGNSHIAEARVAGQWKTVLAASMGSAAKGVFALDVTRPDQFMQGARVLFEFTESDDADMGYVTSSPFIAKINIKKSKRSNKNANNNDDYFVVVPSGNNANDIDNKNRKQSDEQFLFLLSLNKSPTMPWSKNSNYYKISVDSNNRLTPNTLSTPVFTLNKQGAISYGYAGDAQGNLWRFDYTVDNPAAISPKIIFSAKDNTNNPQPITAQPVVSMAPDGGYLILFGTGNAKNNLIQNSFYAIHDPINSNKGDYVVTSRSQLAHRELVPTNLDGKSGYKVTGKDFTYATTSTSDKKGWYVDYLNNSQKNSSGKELCKERSVSEGSLGYGTVFFNTIIPSGSACNQLGTSISYRLNAITGQSTDPNLLNGIPSQTTILGAPILVTTNTSLGERDSFGRRYNTQHYSVLNFGTGHVEGSFNLIETNKATLKAGRLSWREISNWQDLKMER